jgi:hypothetical protein
MDQHHFKIVVQQSLLLPADRNDCEKFERKANNKDSCLDSDMNTYLIIF